MVQSRVSMTVRRVAAALSRYTLCELVLFGYSLVLLAMTSAALRRRPPALLAPRVRWQPSGAVRLLLRETSIARVSVVVAHAARLASGTCLSRALVTQSLLRAYGTEAAIVIGAKRNGARLAAHAWLEVDGHPIDGRHEQFTVLHVVKNER